jgi:hypothetical protein
LPNSGFQTDGGLTSFWFQECFSYVFRLGLVHRLQSWCPNFA